MDTSIICPNGLGDIINCQNWFSTTSNTPDYYHLCQPGLAPNNWIGWQMPLSDSAYLGIAAFAPSNAREYISGSLISPLIGGLKYCAEFYVSLADSSNAAIANIGLYLSQNNPLMLVDSNSNPFGGTLNYTPILESNSIIDNKTDWILIADTFVSLGGEQYFTIGNFRFNSNTVWDTVGIIPPSGGVAAYYYIDNVSIYLCEDTAQPPPPPVEPISALTAYNAFSPNGDGVNDLFTVAYKEIKTYRLQIFNRWGNLIFETDNPAQGWDGRYNGGEVPEGTYYYLIEATGLDEKGYLLKGFIMLVR